MMEGSATIRVTTSDGRRRIFQLLIAIALIGKFVEAPRLEESGLSISSNRQAKKFVFRAIQMHKKLART